MHDSRETRECPLNSFNIHVLTYPPIRARPLLLNSPWAQRGPLKVDERVVSSMFYESFISRNLRVFCHSRPSSPRRLSFFSAVSPDATLIPFLPHRKMLRTASSFRHSCEFILLQYFVFGESRFRILATLIEKEFHEGFNYRRIRKDTHRLLVNILLVMRVFRINSELLRDNKIRPVNVM